LRPWNPPREVSRAEFHRASISQGNKEYIEYFEDQSAVGGLKFQAGTKLPNNVRFGEASRSYHMGLTATIRQFIIENFMLGEDENLEEDTSFLESGVIDSTGILELVSFIEETFEIAVKDEELVPESLDSIANVVQYVRKKMGV